MIELAMARLETGWSPHFLNELSDVFILDDRLLTLYDIKDISQESVPFDFSRNEKIHSCWEIRKIEQTQQAKKWPEEGPWHNEGLSFNS